MIIKSERPKPHEFGDGILYYEKGGGWPHRSPDGNALLPVAPGSRGTAYVCDVCGKGFVVDADPSPGYAIDRLRPESWRERRRRQREQRMENSGDYG